MAKKSMVLKRTSKKLTPRLCSSLETQLPGTLFVTIFSGFLLQSDRLKQVKTTEISLLGLVLGDRDRLIEVTV